MRSDDDELVPRTLAHRPPVRLRVAPPEPGASPEPGALLALTRVVMEPGDPTGYISSSRARPRTAAPGSATALYRRHGFAVDTEDIVWRRALR